MKKIKSAFVFGGALIGIILCNGIRTPQEDFSLLEMANIEALSGSEVGSKCGGCDTSYHGEYCCTLVLNGMSFILKHPKTLL